MSNLHGQCIFIQKKSHKCPQNILPSQTQEKVHSAGQVSLKITTTTSYGASTEVRSLRLYLKADDQLLLPSPAILAKGIELILDNTKL